MVMRSRAALTRPVGPDGGTWMARETPTRLDRQGTNKAAVKSPVLTGVWLHLCTAKTIQTAIGSGGFSSLLLVPPTAPLVDFCW